MIAGDRFVCDTVSMTVVEGIEQIYLENRTQGHNKAYRVSIYLAIEPALVVGGIERPFYVIECEWGRIGLNWQIKRKAHNVRGFEFQNELRIILQKRFDHGYSRARGGRYVEGDETKSAAQIVDDICPRLAYSAVDCLTIFRRSQQRSTTTGQGGAAATVAIQALAKQFKATPPETQPVRQDGLIKMRNLEIE